MRATIASARSAQKASASATRFVRSSSKAHSAPRFVEDVVREMLRYAHDALADAPDDAFILARQVNYESIHKHDALAESCALLGELRLELAGTAGVSHTSFESWLYPRSVKYSG